MKRFVFIILLCIAVSNTNAQTNDESKISFATTVGTGLSMSEPSFTPFTWQVLSYYSLSGRWRYDEGERYYNPYYPGVENDTYYNKLFWADPRGMRRSVYSGGVWTDQYGD